MNYLLARRKIAPYIYQTPLLHSLPLSHQLQTQLFLKLENEQVTGSFKARGAMYKLLTLSNKEKQRGVVAASTGNHGQAVARAARLLGVQATIYVPKTADPSKIAAIGEYGAQVKKYGMDSLTTELYAKQLAAKLGKTWVSPYNDPDVIAGQGTVGVEIAEQLEKVEFVFVTVGGGGLIAGIADYLKKRNPNLQIIGCLPKNSPEMAMSVRAGKFVECKSLPTLSDGSAGGFEADAISFPMCQRLVDDFCLVTEAEIKSAIRLMVNTHHKIIEGSAGVALASAFKFKQRLKGKNAVVVICGGNISTSKLKKIL